MSETNVVMRERVRRFDYLLATGTRGEAFESKLRGVLIDSEREHTERDAELATLRHKLAEAEKELARSRENRLLICSHCGHGIEWDSSEPKNTVSAMQAHELTCAENPLRAALATAEADCAAMRDAAIGASLTLKHCDGELSAIKHRGTVDEENVAQFSAEARIAHGKLDAALTRSTGQSILDELSAARAVCEVAQWAENGGLWPENYADVLAAYRAAHKANTGANQ